MPETRTAPRKVDWTNNAWDFDCALMGQAGLSTKAIAMATGLTPFQVMYRLGKGRIKRSEYRDGTSEVARIILKNSELFSRVVERHVKQAGNGKV